MRNSRLLPALLLAALTAAPRPAPAAPVVDAHPMATQAGCPANVGVLNMSVDVFGAFGSGVAGAGDANYDPVDAPDAGVHGTVYEAMTFMCFEQGGATTGEWLELARQNAVPYVADGTPNHMTSSFTIAQVDVALDARLDCNVLTLCYTLTNGTGARIDNLVLFPYLDGDLFFNGRFNNDYAATNAGQPRTVFEFDQGDDPAAPTTYLAMYGTDPADARLSGWETAQYNEGQARVQDTFAGCNTLRNGLTKRVNANADVDGNLVTDTGFDVSLALRYSAGALAPGATSPQMCFNIQWGQGRQCSDEDHDNVCVPQDNCPAVPNPTQTDSDGDGVGDACDAMCVPAAETCNGLDDDCDGTADDGNPGAGAACNTGAAGVCAAGTTACSNGALRCNATNQPTAEICDGLDNDCDGRTDQNAAGQALFQPCYSGPNGTLNVGVCRAGTQTCAGGAYGACAGQVAPGVEICDALDNDCDATADDGLGVGNACTAGVGACRRNGVNVCGVGGAVSCNAVAGAPGVEICDALDNDCDGAVDDNLGLGNACTSGVGTCARNGVNVCGVGGAVSCNAVAGAPGVEICDTLDNDCDGAVDDNLGLGNACSVGVGACRRNGVNVCGAAGAVTCNAVAGAPGVETCDNIDNDCDGTVDDNLGLGNACSVGVGACRRNGVNVCGVGGAVACNAVAGNPVAELCDSIDNDCDGAVDDNLGLGNACTSGVGTCARNGVNVCGVGGAVSCNAVAGAPGVEICDALDNDCDGAVDDNLGLGNACSVGVGACRRNGVNVCGAAGAVTCNAVAGAPGVETCDNIDNDCDGTVDDNLGLGNACSVGVGGCRRNGVNVCGVGGAVACNAVAGNPVAELCDSIDNDCDGAVDDNLGLGNACSVGVGACARNGVNVCGAGGAVSCNAMAGAPGAEVCDGLDNDCDGAADNGDPGGGAPCVSAQPGVCANGSTACVAGALACRPLAQPAPEICDSLDNDCNGRVDDVAGNACACAPGSTRVCYSGPAGTQGVGRCRTGTQVCAPDGRSYGACAGEVGPAVEACNAVDDDCDGTVDDAAGVGDHCAAGLGACERRGHLNCDLRVGAVVCDAAAGPAGAEVCNGLDDDCDGATDDGLDLGAACEVGLGVCRAAGVRVCDAAGCVVCSATAGLPGSETCDGRDDDCDGETDEGDPGGGVDCPTGDLGACATGVTHCRDGAAVCDAVTTPEPETCNGRDDDCNGEVDDDPASADGRLFLTCFEGAPELAGVGRCAEGRRHCLLNDYGPCEGQRLPEAETCNTADDDCNDRVDDLPGGGVCLCAPGDVVDCYSGPGGTAGVGTCAPGIQVCRADAQGYDACQGESLPGVEACNGVDDDCDAQVDEPEDVPGADAPCRVGVGACAVDARTVCDPVAGVVSCAGVAGAPTPETCNGLDDDCNGVVDDPDAAEQCNGLDDDCDGDVDEDAPGGGEACDTGVPGVCAEGLTACRAGAVACDAQRTPGAETCNGLDDDCNGAVDDALPEAEPCETDLPGVCVEGRRACEGGEIACRPAVPATDELCDGLDNDCDGDVDDAVVGADAACGTGLPGACRAGRSACAAGAWSCTDAPTPSPEVCNLEDDDCDGIRDDGLRNACGVCGPLPVEVCDGADQDCDDEIDEGARCPEASVCAFGRCVPACNNNECGDDLICVEGACVNACDLADCAEGEGCRAGVCFDLCAEVTCGDAEFCDRGRCLPADCANFSCPERPVCEGDDCVDDPCEGVTCGEEQFCRGGACVPSCAPVACPFGETCTDGACRPDPCAEVQCGPGERCREGACEADPCDEKGCGRGEVCVEGECLPDPCAGIVCPLGERCAVEHALAQCVADWQAFTDPGGPDAGPADAFVQDAAGLGTLMDVPSEGVAADGGRSLSGPAGGCGCRTRGPDAAPGILGLAVAVVAVGRRRRRRT